MEVIKNTFISKEGRKVVTSIVTGLKDISNKEEVLKNCVIVKCEEKHDSYGSFEEVDEKDN